MPLKATCTSPLWFACILNLSSARATACMFAYLPHFVAGECENDRYAGLVRIFDDVQNHVLGTPLRCYL